MARGLLVQAAAALPPGPVGLAVLPPGHWAWATSLPHAAARSPDRLITVGDSETPARVPTGSRPFIALARCLEELPTGCDTIVRVHGPTRAEIVRSPVHPAGFRFRPELVTRDQAGGFAVRLGERARAAGLIGRYGPVPASVTLAELAEPDPAVDLPPSPGTPAGSAHLPGLAGVIGIGEEGRVTLDLVAAGPHAVVGGTTGSGKSELLVTWVAAMAAAHPHDAVTFLLIDFKGGAAFHPLVALPHCVGLITDLDGRQAARALASLAAELRHRERAMRAAGTRDITELNGAGSRSNPLPRLVIVVDEFATMLTAFPELHALFVDIAARGRSLGVHLILCTQRPNGVVRDALLANCNLRVSLRVNNRADSQAVLGTDAAAALPASVPGRCLISALQGDAQLCQVATTTEADLRAIVGRGAENRSGEKPNPRRPWLDPLPRRVTRNDLARVETAAPATGREPGRPAGPATGVLLGLLDEPEHQRYRVARYDPERDGHLLVVGAGRAGKSTVLASVAAQHSGTATVLDPRPDVESVWDTLAEARAWLDAGSREARLILLDDFDSVYARWGDEHRAAALELLTGLLRDGPAAGLVVVVAVQHLSGALQTLPAFCQSRLVLRMPDAGTHLAAGADPALFDAALPPGGGCWNGSRIQLLQPEPSSDGRGPEPAAGEAAAGDVAVGDTLAGHRSLLVVAASPARTIAALSSTRAGEIIDLSASANAEAGRLRVLADDGAVLVGDTDTWQARWSLLGLLRPHMAIVFDGCSLADFRAISRRRDLPPPLAPGRCRVWVLCPDGAVVRGTLPAPG
ncbi:FtsK/SpoIIIE domain-containing protein [Cryobacterium sp. MP_M3]